jgi:sugar diacid utilization regulator
VLPAPADPAALTAAVAATGGRAVAGCTVPLADAPKSLRWARLAARLRDEAVLPDCQLLRCDDHVPTLLLHAEPGIGAVLVARRLQPLAELPLARRLKFARLLAAWLEYGGSQAELAQTMNARRQTVHYRIGRLQAMFGAQLADRDARLEILLALRWALPQWEREVAG